MKAADAMEAVTAIEAVNTIEAVHDDTYADFAHAPGCNIGDLDRDTLYGRLDNWDSALEQRKKNGERNTTKKRISVVKFESFDELIKYKGESLNSCHWPSSLGSLRPRSGTAGKLGGHIQDSGAFGSQKSNVFQRINAQNCTGRGSRDRVQNYSVQKYENLAQNGCHSELGKDEAFVDSKSGSASTKEEKGRNETVLLDCENPLKIKKYLYAGLERPSSSKRLPKSQGNIDKASKDGCRGMFLLTHKSAQKYSMQIHTKTKIAEKQSKSPVSARGISSSAKDKTCEVTMKNTDQIQAEEHANSLKKVLIDLNNLGPSFKDTATGESKKRSSSKRGCSARALGEIRSCSTCSPISRKASKKSANSQHSVDLEALQHIGYITDEWDIPKQRLLPQNQMKKPLKLRVSDILSTADSIQRIEKCKQIHTTEIEQHNKLVKNKKAGGTKKRKPLDIPSTVQSIWPQREGRVTQNRILHIDPIKKTSLQNGKIAKALNIKDMDDRLGKSPEDAAHIMRRRDRMTWKILQESTARR